MSRLVINKYSPDKKYLSVLITFLIWLILGFVVCFVGINNIFAATYTPDNFTAQLYDNLGPTLNEKTTSKETDYYYGYTGLTAYSSGGAWGVSSPIPLVANHTYSMTVDPYAPGCGYTILSSYPRLGVGTSLANAKTSYQNNTNVNEKFYQAVSNSRYLQYVFTPSINATYIVFPFATTSTCSSNEVQLSSIVIEDLGESSVTQDQINTSLTNQTTEIQSSIDNSTNTIIGEIDDMEQSIVDSNKETQEVIKDQFNSCRDSYNLLQLQYSSGYTYTGNGVTFVVNDDYSVTVSGTATATTFLRLQHNIALTSGTYYFSGGTDGSGTHIQLNTSTNYYANTGSGTKTMTFTEDLTILYVEIRIASGWTGEYTFYPMISKEKTSYEPYGKEICTNKLDEANETSKGIWQTIKELPSMFLDMLLGLFIPEDLSFIDNFKEVISNKLGFIASIPIQIIDFALGLVNVAFDEITSISFPSLSIFGFNFWNAEEIDITIMLEKLKPFRYFTDFTCVILCCRTLYDLYHKFTGGGAN